MENIKLKIREKYMHMSKAEKRISDFILANAFHSLGMTAQDLANGSGVSAASIIRYVQNLGFDGLSSFKMALAAANSQDDDWNATVDPIINTQDSLQTLSGKLEGLINGATKDFFYQLDYEALEQAICKVRNARRIYLLGIGASMLPAYDLFHKLKRADYNADYYFDINMCVEFFHYIDARDLVIAFSYSGQSREILYSCQIARERQTPILAITRREESPLRRLADLSLLVPNQEAVVRIGAFTSLHTSLLMGDLLYLGAVQKDLPELESNIRSTRKLVEGLKTRE
jgi:DNA-binding MurR/RpiR family transcriptional regulator